MGQWALPPDETVVFTDLLHEAVAGHRPEARWLRGGFWRNFQVKYREINDLHKQMLRTSDKVAAMPEGPERTSALDHLHRGQSNDCYWHGLFGGIYISHMRLATYEHLIAAEDAADTVLRTARVAELLDLDMDGRDEVRLADLGQVVTVKPSEGAGIGGWDIRAARHALTAVLRRRPEAYHATLRAHGARESAGTTEDQAEGGEVTSIHDIVMVKESGLAGRLHYDDHERRSGLVRFLSPGCRPPRPSRRPRTRSWGTSGTASGRSTISRPARSRCRATAVRSASPSWPPRRSASTGGRLDPQLVVELELHHRGAEPDRDAPRARVLAARAGRRRQPVGVVRRPGRAVRARRHGRGGRRGGHRLRQRLGRRRGRGDGPQPAADAWWSPIETVSNSESGFERVYQGSTLLLSWPARIEPGETRRFAVSQRVAVARDRAAGGTREIVTHAGCGLGPSEA